MNGKPQYRVAAAGLDPRDERLIEIVFKHSRYNKYAFVLATGLEPGAFDILIVNAIDPLGLKTIARIRAEGPDVPVISAVPRGAPSSAKHAISIDRLTLQLLPILNRVVELELGGAMPVAAPDPETEAAPAAGAAAAAARAPRAATAPDAAAPGLAPAPAQRAVAVTPAARPTAAEAEPPVPTLSTPLPAAAVAAPTAVPRPVAAGPARASNLVAFPLSPPDASSGVSERLRVLVVDDSPTVRQQLATAFNRMGLLCEVAASSAEALQRLDEQRFDLAMVDVIMPEMDGYKLTRAIKKRQRNLPVIILTSRSSPFDLARGALAGCDSYLTKPVALKSLEAALVKQLRRSLAIDDLSGLLRTSADRAAAAAAQARAGVPGAPQAPAEPSWAAGPAAPDRDPGRTRGRS